MEQRSSPMIRAEANVYFRSPNDRSNNLSKDICSYISCTHSKQTRSVVPVCQSGNEHKSQLFSSSEGMAGGDLQLISTFLLMSV